MTASESASAVEQLAERYGEPRLADALRRLQAGYSIEEGRTFFPTTAGVLEDAWTDLQEEFTIGDEPPRDAPAEQAVHARSLEYATPIDATLAQSLKEMHGKLENPIHRPDRYSAPTVLSMSWHEPAQDGRGTIEKGFLVIYEIAGGAGYLIQGQPGAEYWTIGVKPFEKELIQIFKPSHHWKIDYTTGEKIRTLLKTIGVYEDNLAPRFDEEHDVRDYPDDYEAGFPARNEWPARVFEAYE